MTEAGCSGPLEFWWGGRQGWVGVMTPGVTPAIAWGLWGSLAGGAKGAFFASKEAFLEAICAFRRYMSCACDCACACACCCCIICACVAICICPGMRLRRGARAGFLTAATCGLTSTLRTVTAGDPCDPEESDRSRPERAGEAGDSWAEELEEADEAGGSFSSRAERAEVGVERSLQSSSPSPPALLCDEDEAAV